MQDDLFGESSSAYPLDELVRRATESLTRLFAAGHPGCIAFSGGKDSGCVASLVLLAAKAFKSAGGNPLVLVTVSDTKVENPEIANHYRAELAKMRQFGKAHGIRVKTIVAMPNLLSTWQAKVLTGRGLPSFAGTNADCSVDLKIEPQRKLRKQVFAGLEDAGIHREPLTCLGTRLAESEKRALAMRQRSESASLPARNKDGDLILSPLMFWTVDDVWEYLAEAGQSGEAYSDFRETFRIYAHAEGQSCAIVAEAIREGSSSGKKGGCGARHGCFVCQQAEDKSLENMVAHDPRYAYAKGLLRLNQFIRNTRYDWNRRNWVGRTIRAGMVCIEPDTYHPTMIRELFRYLLQLDFDEQELATTEGRAPMFRVMPEEMVFAIDAYWSLNGIARPFAGVADYVDVFHRGVRYDIPEVDVVRETAMPAATFLHVGDEWDSDNRERAFYVSGLRDPLSEALTENAPCHPEMRKLKDGSEVWRLPPAPSFSMNAESLEMIMEFELERLAEMYHQGYGAGLGGIVAGFKWYAQYGAIEISPAQATKIDEVLRRTSWKDRHGLCVGYSIDDLRRRSVRFAEMPESARQAWSHKATTDSAQTELLLAA